jgi:hypothetical protein
MQLTWRVLGLIAFSLLIVRAIPAGRADGTDSRLAFVTEYLRELTAQESIRDNGSKELDQGSTIENQLMSCIHSSTALQLELGTGMGKLQGMQFAPRSFHHPASTCTGRYGVHLQLFC